ncbi:MAG: hypothetical protein K6T63_14155 [Alicyclobacillus herbarius]|uniref:hypothetical protein n=1 Tax=Alicyclobacillus herbarius TaxID=122960 RepID=UPI0023535F48|nr:hypothetical protein [Alicyclobacillus herbarius]MCL6633760.1 hypothetical protein [Alicyclobacillus herbarius]
MSDVQFESALSNHRHASVAGFFIQHFGWTWGYIMLAFACALTFVPMFFLKETAGRQVAQQTS